jgi:hypothetical protein
MHEQSRRDGFEGRVVATRTTVEAFFSRSKIGNVKFWHNNGGVFVGVYENISVEVGRAIANSLDRAEYPGRGFTFWPFTSTKPGYRKP